MAKQNEIVKTSGAISGKTIFFGALAGAFAGIIAANLLQKRSAGKERESLITPAEGIQLGLLLFGLFKAISNLGDDKK
jgi:hypothetical protein